MRSSKSGDIYNQYLEVHRKLGNYIYTKSVLSMRIEPSLSVLSRKITTFVPFIALYFPISKILSNLASPIQHGDMLQVIQYQYSMISHGGVSQNFGFPLGQNLGFYPMFNSALTICIYLLFKIFNLSIFESINIMITFSFVLNAAVFYKIARVIGFDRLLGSVYASAVATLPFGFARVAHFDFVFFGIMVIPLIQVIRVYLSLNFRRRYIVLSGLILGMFNPYYVVFGVLATIAFTLFAIRNSSRKTTRSLILANTLTILASGLALFLQAFGYKLLTGLFSAKTVNRSIIDTYTYSGDFFLGVTPLPWTKNLFLVPLNGSGNFPVLTEAQGWSNYGSILTLCAFVLSLIGVYFRGHLVKIHRDTLMMLFGSLLVLLSFFIRGGLNIFFAEYVHPSIRSWNRLLPLIQALMILIALYWLTHTVKARKMLWLPIVILLLFTQSMATAQIPIQDNRFKKEIETSGKILRDNFSPGCAILQLPLMGYPEVPPIEKMSAYDHFLLALESENLKYSYGAVKNTESLSYQYENYSLGNQNLYETLKKDGFCGIIFDRNGFVDVAEEKAWLEALDNRLINLHTNRWSIYKLN